MAGNSRVSDAFIVHPSVGYAQIGTHVLLLYFLFLTGIFVCYPLPLEYTSFSVRSVGYPGPSKLK